MDDVAYYDSQLQYQKRVGEIEKERLRLEREMFSMMRSDKKLQNLRAAKLRSYWQQVCEREKKAKERNEDLLRDFEELEIKLLAMETRTNKLRKMKIEYDEKIKQMYPKWRQEVEITRAKKQLQEKGISIQRQKESQMSPVNQELIQPAVEFISPPRDRTTSLEIATPRQAKSPAKTPDVTSLFTASASVASPAKSLVTSTPKSAEDVSELAGRESVRPPDSFADTAPHEISHVTATSSIKSPQRVANVVHTIPTALPSEGANSDFSDTSLRSDKMVAPAVTSTPQRIQTKSSETKHPVTDLRSESDVSVTSPTPSHTSAGLRASEEKHTKPASMGVMSSSSPMTNVSPLRAHQTASPITAISEQREMLPGLRPGSKLSVSSFGSDDISLKSSETSKEKMSPRSNQPLTANATYQALLKQHSGANAKSLEIPEMDDESDEDDLENLLSPHASEMQEKGDGNSESDEDETFSDSNRGASPVYIPTALSSRPNTQVRQQQHLQQQHRPVPKAPWDSDSEDEYGKETTNLSNTGGSSMWDSKLKKYDPQDDFDFYD